MFKNSWSAYLSGGGGGCSRKRPRSFDVPTRAGFCCFRGSCNHAILSSVNGFLICRKFTASNDVQGEDDMFSKFTPRGICCVVSKCIFDSFGLFLTWIFHFIMNLSAFQLISVPLSQVPPLCFRSPHGPRCFLSSSLSRHRQMCFLKERGRPKARISLYIYCLSPYTNNLC